MRRVLCAAWLLAGCTTGLHPAWSANTDESGQSIDATAAAEAEAELVAVLANFTPEQLRWSLEVHGCMPNWWAECSDPRPVETPRNGKGSATAELLVLYAQYLTLAPVGPERARRTVEYGELLMIHGHFDEAIRHSRGVLEARGLDIGLRTRAARLVADAHVAIWMELPPGRARLAAAIRVRDLLFELAREQAIWTAEGEDAAALRELVPPFIGAAKWDIGMNHRRLGLEGGERQDFAVCATELVDLVNSFEIHPHPDIVLDEAAKCAGSAHMIGIAIQISVFLVERYPHSERAPDALFLLAETYRSVLLFRQALEHYRTFSERHPADERAAVARTRWLQLAMTLGDPVAEIVAAWREGTPEERKLAAAVEFRSASRAGEIAALTAYLDRYRVEGGPAREVAVRVALVSDALRRSCPDATRAKGLCTALTADGRLGEVLKRSGPEKRAAERELGRVVELMSDPTWKDDPIAAAGPPLALELEQLRAIEATVALLLGDLSAEEALGVQPPRTFEPSRTRIWLDERKSSVAAMIAAYESVGSNDAAQAAAAAERTAQVYESDATLLSRVEHELRARGELELAAELGRLEAERLSQALAAYQQCLAAVAAHGDDPWEVQGACKRGVGRLSGIYEVEVSLIGGSSLRPLLLGSN